MKINAEKIKLELSFIIDPSLAELVVNCYVNMQKRYYSSDWKPAELDGGQFCEAIARAVYQLNTNTVYHALPGSICDRLTNERLPHNIGIKDRDHFCRVLRTTYKFRNDRGVAHISPSHLANLLDATFIMGNVKWMFSEFLRLAWNKDPNEVAAIIEAIIQLEHPLIHELDGQPLILSNILSAPEEILVYVRHSSNGQLTRNDLKKYVRASPEAIDIAIKRLCDNRQLRMSTTGEVVITPLGEQRVREEIIVKLSKPSAKRKNR